jgi:hypothetical protein
MNTLVWVLVAGLSLALVAQGLLMRASCRRKVAAAQARQSKSEEAANGRLEQTKRQVAKLQSDLAAARLQLKQLSRPHPAAHAAAAAPAAPAATPSREALERELDRAESSRAQQPAGDGFADTQPAVTTQFGSLLMQ